MSIFTLSLVVVHSAMALADCPTLSKVTVDVAGLDPETYADLRVDDLYKSLLIRLLEERVAVVGRDEPSDMTLRLERAPENRLRIEILANGTMRSDEVAIANDRLADLHLAVLHACIELLRTIEADCAPAPNPTPQPPKREEPSVTASRKSGVTVGSYFVYGASRSALMATLDYQIELTPRAPWRWMVAAFLLPPWSEPSDLTLFEWGAQTGLVLAPRLASSWSWQMSATVGFDRESYRFAPPQLAAQNGSRVDVVGVLQTGLAKSLARHWALRANAGVMGLPRDHIYVIDGAMRLHIAAARFIAGLTLSYVWE